MFTIFLLLITCGFAWLAFTNLKQALVALVVLLPSYLLRLELLGIPTTLLELFVLIVILAWLVGLYRKNRWSTISSLVPRPWWILMGLWVLAFFLATLVAPDTRAAMGITKAYGIEPILLSLVFLDVFDRNLKPLLRALGFAALGVALFGIWQWISGAGIPIPWDFERRIVSVYPYPNAVGLFLGPIVILALARAVQTHKAQRLFWISVIATSLPAIVLAKSEAALVSIVATTLIAGVVWKKTRTCAIGIGLLVLVLALTLTPLRDKIFLQDHSGQVRLTQWSETTHLLRASPIVGAGLSAYPTALAPFHRAKHIEIFQYPHTIFFNVWVELGLLGFLLLCATGLLLVRSIKRKNSAVGMACALALLQIAIHGLVDVPYFKNDLAILVWLLIVGVIAYDTRQKN